MKAVYARKLKVGDIIMVDGQEKTVVDVAMVVFGGWRVHCTDGTSVNLGRYDKVVRL